MFKFLMLCVYTALMSILCMLKELNIELFSDEYISSILFIFYILFIYMVRYKLDFKLFSAFSIFYISCIMFFGGRLISSFLFGYTDIFQFDFFFSKTLSSSEINLLLYYVFIGFLCLEIGLVISTILFNNKKYIIADVEFELKDKYAIILSLSCSFFVIYESSQAAIISKLLGYEYLYVYQTGVYNSGILSSILAVFTGICLSQKNIIAKKILLFSMFISMMLYLYAGKRAEIFSFIFLILWLYTDYGRKNVNKKYLFVFIFTLSILILLFDNFSVREFNNNMTEYNVLANLFYEMGGTLLIFEHSTHINSYPIIPYIQSFIPGTSFFIKLVAVDVDLKDAMFSLFLSYQTSETLFYQGFGLGWSFLSDAYVFGFKNIVLYSVFIILFSIFINYLQYSISKNIYSRVILCTILMNLVFLPRDSISSIFPIMWYCVILTFIFKFLMKNKLKESGM